MRSTISIKTAEKIAEVWDTASSLGEAMELAGLKTKNERSWHRYRRTTETLLGIELKPLNPQFSTDNEVIESTLNTKEARTLKRFVITSATNDCGINQNYFQSLINFADDTGSQLLVLPVRYRNPDAFHQGEQSSMVWPQELKPYLLDTDLILNRNLVIKSTKIVATATNPLTGLQSLGGTRSAIFGHPQVQMEMIATPAATIPKMMHTTGSISKPKYARNKTAEKAKFNHSFGAIYVEVQGDRFWTFQLIGDSKGEFYYLNKHYTPNGMTSGHRALGLVLGDEHVKFADDKVQAATFHSAGSICKTLKPEILIRHDIHDHYSGSHHHKKDHILRLKKHIYNDDSVSDELQLAVKHINSTTPKDCINYLIESNHDDHLRRWLNETDPKKDLKNAQFYYGMMSRISKAIEAGDGRQPFELYLADKLTVPHEFVNSNQRKLIGGIDVSQHGDRGPNGSRGGKKGFAKSNYKMIAGHTHTPCIEKGFWQVGVSVPTMDYAKGLSSWMVTHCAIYPNGKRCLFNIIKGDWRAKQQQPKRLAA